LSPSDGHQFRLPQFHGNQKGYGCHNLAVAIEKVSTVTKLWSSKPFQLPSKPMPSLEGILSIPTHAFTTSVQVNHFMTLDMTIICDTLTRSQNPS